MNPIDPSENVRTEGSHGMIAHTNRLSKLKLQARLEELGIALEIEPVKVSVAIGYRETHIFGEVPVNHRRDPPKRASMHIGLRF